MAEPPKRASAGWEGMGIAWAIISELLAAFIVVGGLGYLADRVFDTGKVFTAIGLVLGAIAGVYLVYLHYGRGERGDG